MTNRRTVEPSNRLILASASPWRQTLLKQAGFEFLVIPTDVDEETDMRTMLDPEKLVTGLAEKKAISCVGLLETRAGNFENAVILAADTVIIIDKEIIGKPQDRQDAEKIINKLSGRTHDIWTGVCIICNTFESRHGGTGSKPRELAVNHRTIELSNRLIFAEKSSVTFKPMSPEEINAYLDTDDWVGKAGGYQIQKSIKQYVAHIEGDLDNIIGLPTNAINRLKAFIEPASH